MQRFLAEITGQAPRRWPQGRLSGEDDGETNFAIAADPVAKKVFIRFSKPMDWLGMNTSQAREFAKMLNDKADQIDPR